MQVIVCLTVMILFIAAVAIKYIHDQSKRMDIQLEEVLTHEAVVDKVVKRLADLMKEDTLSAKDDVELQAIYKRKLRLEKAMTNCVFGIDKDKTIVKELITSVLQEIFPTIDDLYKIYPLSSFAIEPMWQFEILMERLYPTYKKGALAYLIKKYKWDETRYTIEDGTVPSYNITVEDLQLAYDN